MEKPNAQIIAKHKGIVHCVTMLINEGAWEKWPVEQLVEIVFLPAVAQIRARIAAGG